MRALVDEDFPEAERIVLVLDNLNTHTPAALYATFPPAEAKRIWDKLELHYTPKHGSWLNIAELELSVLARQCLAPAHPRSARPWRPRSRPGPRAATPRGGRARLAASPPPTPAPNSRHLYPIPQPDNQ